MSEIGKEWTEYVPEEHEKLFWNIPKFMAFSIDLIDLDFNPDGIVECSITGEGAFIAPIWCNEHDEWHTKEITFTHWRYYPDKPNVVIPEGTGIDADPENSVDGGY